MELLTLDDLGAMIAREFGHVYERFEQIDRRFEKIDERFDRMDDRFGRLENRMANVEYTLEDHGARLTVIENTVHKINYRVENIESILQEAPPRKLLGRVERLEIHTFGATQPT